jgi:site-specific recombinase XerD
MMTELRQRMIRDMLLRGFSTRTHKSYLGAVRQLAKYYRRPPDELSMDEVQNFLAHMVTTRNWAWSTCNVHANAFRFLYHITLGRKAVEFIIPRTKQSKSLPEILSREEVRQLIDSPPNPKHRLLLATIYAAGLRVSEALKLRVKDIDTRRMTIHIHQGKGRKDRVLPLPKALLQQMEGYSQMAPSGEFLFPGGRRNHPLDITSPQKIFQMAKLRTGITKQGGIHSLRHAYATHMIEDGAEIPVVQQMLGHRCLSTTMKYFHLSKSRMQSIRSPLENLDRPQV